MGVGVPGKKKVVLILSPNYSYVMKTYGGMEIYLLAFLTSTLQGDEWWASPPSLCPDKRTLLEVVKKREIPVPVGYQSPILPWSSNA